MKKYSISYLKTHPFSLVLSGGSALGFAHLGVFKFLEENNLKPCEIVGTSFGALAGALFAQGYTYQELIDITTHIQIKKLISLKYGQGGLENQKVYSYLANLYQDKKLKETQIPLKIVATNFLTGKSYSFSKKDDIKVVDAVMASISIPGVFSPKQINNQYYVDGFLDSNFPVEYISSKTDLMLAVDVNNSSTIIDFRKSKKRLFRRTQEILEAVENTFNWMIINQTREKIKELDTRKQKYIIIEPNLQNYTKKDFNKGVEISNQGYMEIEDYFKEINF